MQATTAQSGGEQHLDIPTPEKETREPHDVFSRCLPSLYRAAYRYLGNPADAEDAVQDAFLSAYKHLDQFEGRAQMSTWLTTIVKNCARMQLRKRARQINLSLDERFGEEEEYSLSELLPDHGPSPEDKCRASEQHRHLMQFVAQLPPSLRNAFELRDLDELTTSEAARALRLKEGTVKGELSRARAKLRRLFRRAHDAHHRTSATRTRIRLAEGK
jgi:RNA polymerase sigma-70 factor (ECF subfamily)